MGVSSIGTAVHDQLAWESNSYYDVITIGNISGGKLECQGGEASPPPHPPPVDEILGMSRPRQL